MINSEGFSGKAPTIYDIAERAGVAPSTVSRALSKPGRVNERTRSKIAVIAAELGYVASTQAQSLTTGRTGSVALLVPDVTNPFYFDIIRGTQLELRARGFTLLLIDTEESAEIELQTLRQLRRTADGLILAASRLTDQQLAEEARRQPLVTINRPAADAPTVLLDTPEVMVQAVDHLASLGHKSITYVSGPTGSWSNHRRWHAIEAAASKRDITVRKIGPYLPNTSSGAAAGDAAIGTGATALVAFNDLIAIGMLQRFKARGVRVPEDISVVGCDDIFGADFCNPPLTTIASPIERVGRVAVSMLMAQLDAKPGDAARKLAVIPTYLKVRNSTGPAPRNPD
nr:LacI family DNA-binding transcriptional regulator [Arthrobacter rhizosphaerae]